MAELSLQDIMNRLDGFDNRFDIIGKEVAKVKNEVVGVDKKVDDMKDQVDTHEQILNGDPKDWKDEGVVGAVRDVLKLVKLTNVIIVTSSGLLALYLNYMLATGGQ